ncbi:MAG: Flp family type IVb pilin [Hyphomonadaceae bacterium]|nr:Flp family type IVb pilin [Hyphomonadaceae bacterium]
MKILTTLNKYWHDKSGATAVEYALVISTLSIVVVSAIAVVGGHTGNTWNDVSNAVTD